MLELFEVILAARERSVDDNGGWLRMLVPLIFVIVYAISGLAKLKSNKRQGDDGAENDLDEHRADENQPLRQTRYKPLETDSDSSRTARPSATAARYSRQALPYVKSVAGSASVQSVPRPAVSGQPEPSVAVKKFLAEALKASLGVPVSQLMPQPVVRTMPQQQKKPQAVTAGQATQPLPKKAEESAVKTDYRVVQTKPWATDRLDELNELQRAVIFSEILAKPLSTRDDSSISWL